MRGLMKKVFMVLLLPAFLTFSLLTSASAKTTWNVNSIWPPKNIHSVGLKDFAEKVNKATNGELVLTVKTGGSMGYKGPDLLQAVRDGLLPVSDMLISGVADEEKLFQVVNLPLLVRNFDELRLLIGIARPSFYKSAKRWNQKILYIAPWPAAGLWTKKKITTMDDFKGLKTRTYDKNGNFVMEAVGATPFSLPFSEVYTSLQTGLIDSVMTSTPTAVEGKFWEVLKYFQPFNITIATNMVTANLRSFEKLSKEQQDALVTAGKEMEKAMWDKVKAWEKDQEAICNKNGIVTVNPTVELIGRLEKITEDIRAGWLKTTPDAGKRIHDEFLKQVKR